LEAALFQGFYYILLLFGSSPFSGLLFYLVTLNYFVPEFQSIKNQFIFMIAGLFIYNRSTTGTEIKALPVLRGSL